MTYWMEVAQWLAIGTALGVVVGEVSRPLVAASRRRRRAQGR